MTTRPENRRAISDLDADAALRSIIAGTASATGSEFFRSLVRQLALTLETKGAWVTEYFPRERRLNALALWMDGRHIDHFEYPIDGTPCEQVIVQKRLVHYPDHIRDEYPNELDMKEWGAVSFMGVPLLASNGEILGHLSVLDSRPMPAVPQATALLEIFADRAAAELERIRAEAEIREREEKLSRLVNSTMDGIIEFDSELRITLVNPAARNALLLGDKDIRGTNIDAFLIDADRKRLRALIADAGARPSGQQALWIPGGLTVISDRSTSFPAEATLSTYLIRGDRYCTVVLRNVNDRIEAEKKITVLTNEAEYLREEIQALVEFDQMIGQSETFTRVLRDVRRVAETDATVLVLGETGTGKELIARAVHAASARRDHPLIKVNCAAVAAALVECQFFGHEKGAFTGATGQREGRFALADGGTIFLDEIAELPIDLQSKLLRVLQEGEFEPVGSSRTRKVDVRVIAATNRELEDEVAAGRFRADLYYRLNVFPVRVPPLRERGDDIILIATTLAERFARQAGRKDVHFTAMGLQQLRAYSWPGNIRELRNLIERAVIASDDGYLNIGALLPISREQAVAPGSVADKSNRILTAEELSELERRNMLAALEATGWRVSGEKGAAAMLGINASTFNSRMRALGLERPGI